MSDYSVLTPTPLPSLLKRIQASLQALGKSCVVGNGSFVIQCPAHDDCGTVRTPGTKASTDVDAAADAGKPIATIIEAVFGTTEPRER